MHSHHHHRLLVALALLITLLVTASLWATSPRLSAAAQSTPYLYLPQVGSGNGGAMQTPVPPVETPTATLTSVPSTETPTATLTSAPSTETPTATVTSAPLTETSTATTVPPTPTATATSNPVSLEILSSRTYTTSSSRYIVGEVLNNSPASAYGVQVMARYYNAAGELVATADGYATLYRTPPGQRNPFRILLLNAPTSITSYDLSLSWRTSSFLDYQPLTVVSTHTRENYGVEVYGEVRNDQAREMKSARAAVTFYDGAGNVLDTDYSYVSMSTLAAGASSIYSILTFDDLVFTSYTVKAEGYLASIGATPTPVANVSVRSERSYSQSTSHYVVGEVINDSSVSAYGVQVMARYFDAADQLVAVSDGYTFLNRTAPGQRNPFQLSLSNAPTTIARYDLTVSWHTTSILNYQPVTVLSTQTRDNFGVEVFGEVRNDQAHEMKSVKVVVTFYDGVDMVVGTDFSYASTTTLAPGGTSIYSISTFDDLIFADYSVQAEGYLSPE